jgi:hypothetical protein
MDSNTKKVLVVAVAVLAAFAVNNMLQLDRMLAAA